MKTSFYPRFLPPRDEDAADCGRIRLRDGKAALVRIAHPKDRKALQDFFERLSPESRQFRFSSMAPPGLRLIASLCNDSDPGSVLTLVVICLEEAPPRIIATGSYVAKDKQTAEVAFAVQDASQGKGLGTLLLRRLARLAVRNGFSHLWAVMHADNQPMQHICRESGFFNGQTLVGTQIEMDLSVEKQSGTEPGYRALMHSGGSETDESVRKQHSDRAVSYQESGTSVPGWGPRGSR